MTAVHVPMITFLGCRPGSIFLTVNNFVCKPLTKVCVSVMITLVRVIAIDSANLVNFTVGILSSYLFINVSTTVCRGEGDVDHTVITLVTNTLTATTKVVL